MFEYKKFKSDIFNTNSQNFEDRALTIFAFQYEENPIYHTYCKFLGKNPKNVQSLDEIPFLPISFFKSQKVQTGNRQVEKVFKSSGTTSMTRSEHHVTDVSFYHQVATQIFEAQYGSLRDYFILALLPSYQEQGDSSLISMVDHFIAQSRSGGYFLQNTDELIRELESDQKKILIGVSYALLDLAENHQIQPKNVILMETGGMKGRRKEMIRRELHQAIKAGIEVSEIHSEYGMTELTSQAYGRNGLFQPPPWMKIMIRDTNDPFSYLNSQKTGGINIIDLANVDSCAFLETMDLGQITENGQFEVLGRFDNSDIRGCNLLV